jgi:hypothetical protein
MLILRRHLATVCIAIILLSLYGCVTLGKIEPGEKNIDENGNKYIITNNIKFYYSENITDEEINTLSIILGGSQTIKLDEIDGIYYVYFIEADDELKKVIDGNEDIEFDKFYENEAMVISDVAFENAPVVINICDKSFNVFKSYKYIPESQ